ncbi:MAG: hypothetical protein HQK79_02140 [Desulfobacterales bacterium]|nr:hypothetical protein [Desulfobacterales bacterium]MBF0398141.1 hypothetical protein [Desulfobacterales bacterium]
MDKNRRNFIKKALTISALAISGSSILPSCHGIKRANTPYKYSSLIPEIDRIKSKILYYASLAPSGHNSQPWYVKILSKKDWIICTDPKRRLPSVDPKNREMILSIGAFMENLSIAAASYGFEVNDQIIAKDTFDEEILKISLNKINPVDYPLERITKRMTAKNGYKSKELKNEDVKFLSEPLNNHLFYFPRNSEHGKCIEEGVIEYFKTQTYRDDAQKELAEWLRLTDEEANLKKDGLTLEGMGITGIAGWYVRNFVKPSDFMNDNFRKKGIEKIAKIAGQGAGWLIITSDGETVTDLINTGRRFERMALIARERMIAIHPMTQYLEEDKGQKIISKNHKDGFSPQFVLRVGYISSYPDPVSLRRPVSSFVRKV